MFSHTLCITPGDPAGIGPEITVKFLVRHLSKFPETAFSIVGSQEALAQEAIRLGVKLPQTVQVCYHHVSGETPGQVAYEALEEAVSEVLSSKAHGLVTGPISKQHLKQAGILASGHTELLEVFCRKAYPHQKFRAEMLFVYRQLRMLLLTRHIPLNRVSQVLMSENFRPTLETLIQFLSQSYGIRRPRLAMMGVNPHAGEIGGVEETLVLTPMMAELQASGYCEVEGPFASDALFRGFSMDDIPYDCYIAAYHDQGLIPFKLIAGHKAVNVTIGLPFIRTSVGHGTAFDIAGKGIATEAGLLHAVETALSLVKNRQPLLI